MLQSEAPTRLDGTSDRVYIYPVLQELGVRCGRPERVAEIATWAPLHGDCQSPVRVRFWADKPGMIRDPEVTTCQQSVRCRNCPNCQIQRRKQWTARAIAEHSWASRTWFATLTFDWRLAPIQTQESQWRYASRQLTLFLKRLRWKGFRFRYLAVFEAHASGRPHIHLLLHESGNTPVRWKNIDAEWNSGFHKTKLVRDPRTCAYVTKYLTKSLGFCRVRASVRYGQCPRTLDGGSTLSSKAESGSVKLTRNALSVTPRYHNETPDLPTRQVPLTEAFFRHVWCRSLD